MHTHQTDIAIIGGGPVGLYLAGILLKQGISCKVLEQKPAINQHSKSLGIHPVSLELFNDAGIADAFLAKGLKIEKGIAFWNREKIGEITFDRCSPPYRFILSIPQWHTEEILEKWVQSLDSGALLRGAEVTNVEEIGNQVVLGFTHQGQKKQISSAYVIGCDGKNSFLRNFLNISFDGKLYPDTYIMGDFSDNTSFGSDAAVYLHEDGLIESFPLPGGHRRWVVKTDNYIEKPSVEQLVNCVKARLGHDLSETKNYMISSFGVQNLLASALYKGRFLLAGDAAHVVSPIGGQGMNLGWIGADMCSNVVSRALKSDSRRGELFRRYSSQQKKLARHTAKRAELNMHLGRKETSNFIYKMGMYILLKTSLSHFLARVFTMRGLGKWII